MIYKPPQSGFSLVETLVAITILLLVIVGPMTIVSSSSRSTSFASEQVTAFFLAQEGAELVEKKRNDLLLRWFENPATTPWTEFTRTNTGAPLRHCWRNDGCNLSIASSGGVTDLRCQDGANRNETCRLYLHTGTTPSLIRSRYTTTSNGNAITPFTRQIMLRTVPGNSDEVQVISKVTWRSGGVKEEQEVTVETRLFNIYEAP